MLFCSWPICFPLRACLSIRPLFVQDRVNQISFRRDSSPQLPEEGIAKLPVLILRGYFSKICNLYVADRFRNIFGVRTGGNRISGLSEAGYCFLGNHLLVPMDLFTHVYIT